MPHHDRSGTGRLWVVGEARQVITKPLLPVDGRPPPPIGYDLDRQRASSRVSSSGSSNYACDVLLRPNLRPFGQQLVAHRRYWGVQMGD